MDGFNVDNRETTQWVVLWPLTDGVLYANQSYLIAFESTDILEATTYASYCGGMVYSLEHSDLSDLFFHDGGHLV